MFHGLIESLKLICEARAAARNKNAIKAKKTKDQPCKTSTEGQKCSVTTICPQKEKESAVGGSEKLGEVR